VAEYVIPVVPGMTHGIGGWDHLTQLMALPVRAARVGVSVTEARG
jgi:hypothetical protein